MAQIYHKTMRIEEFHLKSRFKNLLAWSDMCPNANGAAGDQVVNEWAAIYLQEATNCFNRIFRSLNWDIEGT